MTTANSTVLGGIDMNIETKILLTGDNNMTKFDDKHVMERTANMEKKNIKFLDALKPDRKLGEFINTQRKAVELTVDELAEISGVDARYIKDVEAGRFLSKIGTFNWLKILKFLDMELKEGVDLVDEALKIMDDRQLKQVDIVNGTGLGKPAVCRFVNRILEIPYDSKIFKILLVLQNEYNLLSEEEKAIAHEEIEYNGNYLGNIIRERRKNSKLSLEKIEIITGLDADLILDIENGRKYLTNPNWFLILEALDVKLSSAEDLTELAVNRRKELGISIAELSEKIGIPETVISRFERGVTMIPYKSPVFQLLSLIEETAEHAPNSMQDGFDTVKYEDDGNGIFVMCFWSENDIYRKRLTESELNIVKAIFMNGVDKHYEDETIKCFIYIENNVYSEYLTAKELDCLLILMK